MNIGVYGDSISRYDPNQEWNFVSLLKKEFDANIVHSGIPHCSEERILFNLKKTKKLDTAIIFHAAPYHIFMPSWNKDVSNIDKTTFDRKYTARNWVESMWGTDFKEHDFYIDFFENVPNGACLQLLEYYNIHFENYTDAFIKWQDGDSSEIKQALLDQVRIASDDEKFYQELWTAFELTRKYMYHPDLQLNRYYGALMQIDSYLHNKKIPCVHFFSKDQWYPSWYTITSGPVDLSMRELYKDNSQYNIGYQQSANAMNAEGNKIIFDKIKELLATSSTIP
jgi:hypothetical protein